MKKNGYTLIDALIIIIILSVSAVIILPKVSNALKVNDNTDEIYNNILDNYLSIAEKYGNTIKDKVKEGNNTIISINDLIANGYVHSYSNEIIDIRDNITKMNNIKFKLIYNEQDDKVYVELN